MNLIDAVNQFQQMLQPSSTVEESFVDKNFAAIAFSVSTLALLILAPLDLLLGASIGYALSNYFKIQVQPNERVVTIANATFAIVGCVAAFLRFTPVGLMGGLLFMTLPLLCSMTVGNTLYRLNYTLPSPLTR